jgi:hypothetical protein
MNWPNNDSPFWPLARVAVLSLSAGFLLTVMYQNGFDPKVDFLTILGLVLTVSGFDAVKRSLTK